MSNWNCSSLLLAWSKVALLYALSFSGSIIFEYMIDGCWFNLQLRGECTEQYIVILVHWVYLCHRHCMLMNIIGWMVSCDENNDVNFTEWLGTESDQVWPSFYVYSKVISWYIHCMIIWYICIHVTVSCLRAW